MREGRNVFLHGDYALDRYSNVLQVIGGSLTRWIIPAIVKYRLQKNGFYLRGLGYGFGRTFSAYSPLLASAAAARRLYVAKLRALLPYVTPLDVRTHLKPEETLLRVVKSPLNALEERAVELVESLVACGVRLGELGITGSMSLRASVPGISDIDLTVYSCKAFEALCESGVLKSLGGRRLAGWLRSQSSRLGIPESLALRLYNPCRRGTYKGVPVSVIPSSPRPLWTTEVPDLSRCSFLGEHDLLIEVERIPCAFVFYPHVIKGRSRASCGRVSRGEEVFVVSYESLFSFFYEPSLSYRLLRARGIAYRCPEGFFVLVVGTREETGLLYPVA